MNLFAILLFHKEIKPFIFVFSKKGGIVAQ